MSLELPSCEGTNCPSSLEAGLGVGPIAAGGHQDAGSD